MRISIAPDSAIPETANTQPLAAGPTGRKEAVSCLVVHRTANSPNGVSGEGVPRRVEEAHRCVPGDVRAGNVVEKDALDLLPTDVTATRNVALRTATSASGVRGTSVPRPVVWAISPVIGRA